MAEREHDRLKRRQRIQVVPVGNCELSLSDQQLVPVHRDRHRGRGVTGAERGDQVVARCIVDEDLILILTEDVEAVPAGSARTSESCPGTFEKRAAVLRLAVIDQDAKPAANIEQCNPSRSGRERAAAGILTLVRTGFRI